MVELSPVPSLPPAAPVEVLRQPETAHSAARVTPAASADSAAADPRSRTPLEHAELQSGGRVAFTAKFGPDPVTGVLLTVVRGAEVEAAEEVDLGAILEHKLDAGRDPRARAAALREALAPAEAAQRGTAAETGSTGEAQADLPEGEDSAPPPQQSSAPRGSVLDISI